MLSSRLLMLLLFLSLTAFAQDKTSLRKKEYNLENGIALSGYDAVTYFNSPKPEKGKTNFKLDVQGVTYLFENQKNLEEFKAHSEKYEPQYGGWCAYAMGEEGDKVEVDPKTYKLINGKLYLFYNKFFTNTLDKWNKDEAHLKKQADSNWMKFYKH
jgi:YHS domain-containing protein